MPSQVRNARDRNLTVGRFARQTRSLEASIPPAVPLPSLAIAADAAARVEGLVGLTSFTFTVTRTGDLSGPSAVDWRVSGSGSQRATAPDFADGRLPRGRVFFAAGESRKTITIQVRGDRGIEPDEQFRVTLRQPSNATVGTASAEATIRNDDVLTTVVTPSHPSIAEGQTLTTTVQTTGLNPGSRLYWSLRGEGVEGADLLLGALSGSGRVDINGSFSFRHTLREDARTEGDETLRILLHSDPARRVQVGAPVSVTIQDSSRTPLTDPTLIRESRDISATMAKRGEVDRYTVDVVPGSILKASLTSSNPQLYPLIHLTKLSGSALKNPIAYSGNTADLGLFDLITGQAMLSVKTQAGATGPYTLNVNIIRREAWKDEVIDRTNLERTKAGLQPLTPNSLLAQAAQAHVDDMDASNKYLAHTGSNGSSPVDRIKSTGYKAAWVDLGHGSLRTISSENAAAGYTSPAEVVQAWMNSEGHRAAIMDPATKEIGVGFDYDNETGTTYWLQNFGYPWSPGMTLWF